jgi:hypothetical protein
VQQIFIRLAVLVFAFIIGLSAHALWRFPWHHSAVAETLSTEEKWHRLYEAALMTGDPSIRKEVSDRLLCVNREGVSDAFAIWRDDGSWCQKLDRTVHELRLIETSEYGSFGYCITSSHRLWAMRNLDFVRTVGTAKSARAYVRMHQWPSDR